MERSRYLLHLCRIQLGLGVLLHLHCAYQGLELRLWKAVWSIGQLGWTRQEAFQAQQEGRGVEFFFCHFLFHGLQKTHFIGLGIGS
jgi:hypothetical protein